MSDLCELVQRTIVAMMCYERAHHECHRSVISELLVEKLDAKIVAIL